MPYLTPPDRGLGQIESEIMSEVLKPYMPGLKQTLIDVAKPAAAAAAESAKPAMKEAIADYAPIAISLISGMFIAGIFTAIIIEKNLFESYLGDR